MNKKEKRCSADANVTAPALMIFLAGNRRGNAKRHTPSKIKHQLAECMLPERFPAKSFIAEETLWLADKRKK
ncbi:hypothetical protein ACP3TF_17980 [Erwinia aphidicola]